jgi:hypothetical protein
MTKIKILIKRLENLSGKKVVLKENESITSLIDLQNQLKKVLNYYSKFLKKEDLIGVLDRIRETL